MDWATTLYALPLAIAVAIATTLALYAWRRRAAPGAALFSVVMLAITEWTLGYALELTSINLAETIFWAKVQYPGLVIAPVAWLLFTLDWTGQAHRLTRRSLVLLLIIPLTTLALIWSNDAHSLIWRSVTLQTIGPFIVLDPSYGPWFAVHSLYSHLLVLIGSLILLRQIKRTPHLYRHQLMTLLCSIALPWFSNLLYLFGLSPIPNLDLAPFSFTLAGFGIIWSLFHFRMLDLMPVARDVLIEEMRDGIFVLDVQQRVVDLNPAAGRLLERPAQAIIGQPISAVLPLEAALVQPDQSGDTPTTLCFERGGEQLAYDLIISRLRDRRGMDAGCILVLRDVTERMRAQAATRVSEERYRAVSELTSDYTYALHVAPDGTLSVEWVTDAYTRVTGYSVDQLRALGNWRALIHPDDRAVADEFVAAVLRGESAVRDVRFCHKDGSTRWLQHFGKPIWDEQHRRIVRVLGAGRDITVRTAAMSALSESEQRYRLLFERSPLPMWVYDQQTLAFLAVNRAAVQHYGYSEAEFLAMTITDINVAGESQTQSLTPAEIGCSATPTQWRHCTKNGTPIEVEITAHQISFDGRTACIVLVHDVTERRHVERALRQQNEYLAALHETTLTVMNRLELGDVLEAVVGRAASLVGTTDGYMYLIERNPTTGEDELVVQVGVGVFRACIGFRQAYGVGLSGNVWRTGRPLVVNSQDELPDRSPKFAKNCSGVCVPLTTGAHVVGVIGLAYMEAGRSFGPDEVTLLTRFAQLASIALENARLYTTAQQELIERKRAEADLAQARDQALEAVRLKSEFLAIMSHELRTPLNAIIGFTDLTLDQQIGPLNQQQQSHLQRVSRNARHLLAQINGILDMSKLDANSMPLAHEPMRTEDVLSRAISSIETLVTDKHLHLAVEQPRLRLPLMLGDAGRLQQMLLNLLSNAVKFTPPHGTITVTLEYGRASEIAIAAPPTQPLTDGTWLAFSVQDTGIGIPPEEHERIWSEFYQIDGSATRQYGGTGLGLAIVKRMTVRMGGQVGLRSALDSGSTFTIWLPVAIAGEPTIERALAVNADHHVVPRGVPM